MTRDGAVPDPVPLFPPGTGPGPFQRLFERRIVFLRGPLDDALAGDVVAQLVALDSSGPEEITLFVDSPGGDGSRMFTIHDTVEMLGSPVSARCVGQAGAEAAFLLATATGTRSATPNARVLLREPTGGLGESAGSDREGTAADIETLARELAMIKDRFERILAARTGQPLEAIRRDTGRGLWLSAAEALDYGLLDEIVGRPEAAGAP